jgi:hypothetical protein
MKIPEYEGVTFQCGWGIAFPHPPVVEKIPHTGGGFQFVVRLFIAAAESG